MNGLLQRRGGSLPSNETGEAIIFDATFFTRERGILPEDKLIAAPTSGVPGIVEDFKVISVEEKANVHGVYDHTEVFCSLDTKR